MQEDAFQRYMNERNLAEKTRQQRAYALKRIERAHEVDLDQEFERDGLASLVSKFRYSSGDARTARPNPTRMDIDADKLLTHLRWYLSHLQDYRRFKGAPSDLDDVTPIADEPTTDEAITDAVSQTFGLERDLQVALRSNLKQLEDGMTIADNGSEIKVDAGFIDILARDKDGVWTIIELKAGTSRPAAVAQVLAYMGCIAADKQVDKVRGVLIAADHDARVVYAAKAVPNLSLKSYRHRFEFE